MPKNQNIQALVFALKGVDCFLSEYAFNDAMEQEALKHKRIIRALRNQLTIKELNHQKKGTKTMNKKNFIANLKFYKWSYLSGHITKNELSFHITKIVLQYKFFLKIN